MKMVCKSNCVNTYPLIVGKVYDSVPLPLMTKVRAKDVFKFGKAIAETFHIVTKTNASSFIFNDTTTYVAIALALFASYYGTRYVDASEKRKGIVTAVAIESVLKLIFFLIIGVYVTYFVFDGFEDIYQKASLLDNFKEKNSIGGLPQAINWFLLCLLSMFAIFLLPL